LGALSNQEHNMNKRICLHSLIGTFFIAVLATLAQAGPPLICHPFEIGNAPSLPWRTSQNWNSPDPSYDVKRLVPDTLALLTPEATVLVRMEALRRAAIYADKEHGVAYELLSRLMARALDAPESGSALAWFDAGYLAETYKQVKFGEKRPAGYVPLATDMNGYAWVLKAIRLGGETPAMEFAASLMGERPWPNEHFLKALRTSSDGSLLAHNIVHQFGDGAQTLGDLRARYAKR
jgi:hypothetical protein